MSNHSPFSKGSRPARDASDFRHNRSEERSNERSNDRSERFGDRTDRQDRYENGSRRPDRPYRQDRDSRDDRNTERRPDWAARGDRYARPERSDRQDRNDRGDRQDRFPRQDRPERSDRPRFERSDRNDRFTRSDRGDRPERSERGERSFHEDRPQRFERSDRPERGDRFERGDRPERNDRFERGDRPARSDRPRRGSGLVAELRDLDRDLLRLIVKRSRMLSRLPDSGASSHERDLRTSWEEYATTVSRDPRLVRQLFALLQEVEVIPGEIEQASSFNLAPTRKPVTIDLAAPLSDRLPRLYMALAAASASTGTLHNVPLNDAVLECVKTLNQAGASLRWEDDGRILCQGGEALSGHNKSILDKVVHTGSDKLNLYLLLFLMATRPARLKIIGDGALKFVDTTPLRHFLPLLGARLTSVVPGQDGLPVRLESSAMLPKEVTLPAELPADAAIALCIAATAWDQPLTIHFGEHPETEAILNEISPLLTEIGIAIVQQGTDLTITPAQVDLSAVRSSIDLPTAATFLAMPAFAGGTSCLHGTWDASAQGIVDLLAATGLSLKQDSALMQTVCTETPEEGRLPVLQAQTDLSALPESLLPLGLVLALAPIVREKGGVMPTLPEDTDRVLVDSFLHQVGLAREEEQLTVVEPSSTPWASPSTDWALALSLAAFLRPNIKLGNPGVVQSRLPHFWTLYNSLPCPSLTRKAAEDDQPQEPTRPVRRRVMASYTPESEMPDEIVYPDED